jgi:hypothetical protein
MWGKGISCLGLLSVSAGLWLGGCEAGPAKTQVPVGREGAVAPTERIEQPGIEARLGFRPQEKAVYKLLWETGRGYRFEPGADDKIVDERNRNTLEMTFTQQVSSIDGEGVALATITIDELKYFSQVKNTVSMDFDSSRQADKGNELARLVGKSYQVRMCPDGAVSLVDANQITDAVRGTAAESLAKALFSEELVARWHSVAAFPDREHCSVMPGDSWTKLQAGPRGMIEPRCYEKTYTFKGCQVRGGGQVAVVGMEGTLAAVPCPDTPKGEQGMGIFAKMFDSSDTYKGTLVFTLDGSKVLEYREMLEAKWVATEQDRESEGQQSPMVLTMSFEQVHSVELLR